MKEKGLRIRLKNKTVRSNLIAMCKEWQHEYGFTQEEAMEQILCEAIDNFYWKKLEELLNIDKPEGDQ